MKQISDLSFFYFYFCVIDIAHLVLFVQHGAVLQQVVDYHPAAETAGNVERGRSFLLCKQTGNEVFISKIFDT